ncbi:hypothetical protein BDW72DRAFT_200448 [Aspergillus terricola var. indicus]
MARRTSNSDAGLRPQSGQGSSSLVRGAIDSQAQGRRCSRSQQRKQKSNQRRSEEMRNTSSHGVEHPNRRLKTANDPKLSRRQRNLKNLMMLNRLETNIGRLEARVLDLGFDLDGEGSVQSSRQLTVSDKPHSPSSLSIPGSENLVEEGPWRCEPYSEDTHEDSGVPRTSPSSVMDREDDWMGQKAGMTPRLSSGMHSNATSFGILNDNFPKAFCPLPSKEEATSLLYQYLQNFNCLCPLFEQAKLTSLFNEDNLNTALRVPSCWASVNVVFALGIAFRVKYRTVTHLEHQRSWLFIKNAFGTFHDLCLGQPDLWSIQALLGMSIFFLGTMSAEPCCFLAAAAIRMSEEIGLGRISIRFGKPPTQSDEDMSVDLPTATPMGDGQILSPTSKQGEFDAFRAHCQLATIKGQLYKDLYSAAAKDRPLPEIMAAIGTLDRMLRNWREDLPPGCRPESHNLHSVSQSSISVMLLYLHCSYFNCLIAMHRLIARRGFRISEDLLRKYEELSSSAPPPYTSRTFESETLCADAARASTRLLKYMPEGHISLVGILIHYPIVALTTLSSIIIRNPLGASQLNDLRLMDQVETYLSSLVVSIPNQVIGHLRTYCANYRAAASTAAQKTMQLCAR